MKFTKSLQFNCVPEWSEHYLGFQALKHLSHQIEAARKREGGAKDAQQLEESFLERFSEEIKRVLAFYKKTYAETLVLYNGLQEVVGEWSGSEEMEMMTSVIPRHQHRPSVVGDVSLFKAGGAISRTSSPTSSGHEYVVKFDDKAKDVYLALHDLHEYLYMNHTGFSKLAKSFDKHAQQTSSAELMKKVDASLPMDTLVSLDAMMQEIEKAYAMICCEGNLDEASVYLRHLLHERIIYERSSVWKDLVSAERKANEISVVSTAPVSSSNAAHSTKKKSPVSLFQIISGIVCIAVYIFLFFYPLLKFDYLNEKYEDGHGSHLPIKVPQNIETVQQGLNRALALFVSAIILFFTEAIPLYVTGLLIPCVAIVSRILTVAVIPDDKDLAKFAADGKQILTLIPKEAAKDIFGHMFSKNIMLLLSSFTLTAALTKTGISKILATAVLSRVGRRPTIILFWVMMLVNFLSAIISNIGAPMIVFSIIGPILRTLGADHPLAKALVLGVAYAGNIGGMTSLIASPQNIATVQALNSPCNMDIGFGPWLFAAFPTSLLCIVVSWAVVYWQYPCKTLLPESCVLKSSGSLSMTRKQIFVSLVSVLTIILWAATGFSPEFKKAVGDMAIIGIIPIVAFFFTGILGKEDFNGFMWNIIILVMGGSALSHVLEKSLLLSTLGSKIVPPGNEFVRLAIYGLFVLVITTVISHTVGAMVFLPLIAKAESNKGTEGSWLAVFVIVGGLMTSAGMGTPISGFPNMCASNQEDATGRRIIGMKDFLRTGILASVLVYVVITSVGFGLTSILAFKFPSTLPPVK